MTRYRVTVKRSFVEYADVEVDAEDECEASEEAMQPDRLDSADWTEQSLEEEQVDGIEELTP